MSRRPRISQRLDHYRTISRRLALAEVGDAEARALAAEGKAVVWIDGGLHADEVLGAQQLIELVYQLASGDDAGDASIPPRRDRPRRPRQSGRTCAGG